MSIKNESYLRARPEWGPRLVEALNDLVTRIGNLEQQTNTNTAGNPEPPPTISGLKVSGQNGHFNVAIQDDGEIYRDIHYYVEHADNPNFTNPVVEHLGHTRNTNLFLGNTTRYFRAYSAYSSSSPSQPVYHGGPTPLAVEGGGAVGPPSFQPGQSSGTGQAGTGLQGPGVIPFRSGTGVPPVRGK